MIEHNNLRKHPDAHCEVCPLFTQNHAPSHGPTSARVAIVSRSPGFHDVSAGRPFAGPSGKLLDHLLALNNTKRDDVFTTNVVLCQSEKLSKDAIEACRPRLVKELRDVRPDVIIAAGSEAVKELSGRTLRDVRGLRLNANTGQLVVGTYNPAMALRDDSVYPDLVADFKRALNEPQPFTPPSIYLADDTDKAQVCLDKLRRARTLACDVESSGLTYDSRILSVAVSPSDTEGYVFAGDEAIGVLKSSKLLTQANVTYIWHNGKFDVKLLRTRGIAARVSEDTLLLSYALDERPGVHSLDYLLKSELDWPEYEPEEVKRGKKNGFEDFGNWHALYKYNGYDAVGTWRLFQVLESRAASDNVLGVYRNLLIPASEALTEIERRGVKFDKDKAIYLAEHEVKPKLATLNAHAEEIVGREINLNSPKQVSELVYDEYEAENPVWRRGKERSVDARVRQALIQSSPDRRVKDFVHTLSEFRELDKLRSTYLEKLVRRVNSDGRLRCDFPLHGTETGRLSSRNPNLQNQPRGTFIRQLYIAEDGYEILQADYSQAELRVAAQISGDRALQNIYREGRDLHTEVATQHFGPGFTKEQRVAAKGVNFGSLYGIGAFKLHQELSYQGVRITLNECEALIKTFWRTFPQLQRWVASVHRQALDTGELQSPWGRKRRFHLITDQNRDHTLKEAVNFVIQSTASDVMLYALIQLEKRLQRYWSNIILTVHDSIVFELEKTERDTVVPMVREEMEKAAERALGWTDVPILIDHSIAENWGAC